MSHPESFTVSAGEPVVTFLPLYQPQYASSRQRVFQFLTPLQESGYFCRVVPAPQGATLERLLYPPRLLRNAPGSDIIFIQKRLLPPLLLKLLRRSGARLIFDFDDAIYLTSERYARRLAAMLPLIDTVIAGNRELGTFARRHNDDVIELLSVVNPALYPLKETQPEVGERITIGWLGHDPNRRDFDGMAAVFDRLAARFGQRVRLIIVGSRPLTMETALPLSFQPWSLAESRHALTGFDIGIMPLPDTPWTRGKCGFKLIEYMAAGLPVVASPVGVNPSLIVPEETGLLAADHDAWETALVRLIEDDDLRQRWGRAGRARVEKEYSVAAAMPILTKLFDRLLGRSRSGP